MRQRKKAKKRKWYPKQAGIEGALARYALNLLKEGDFRPASWEYYTSILSLSEQIRLEKEIRRRFPKKSQRDEIEKLQDDLRHIFHSERKEYMLDLNTKRREVFQDIFRKIFQKKARIEIPKPLSKKIASLTEILDLNKTEKAIAFLYYCVSRNRELAGMIRLYEQETIFPDFLSVLIRKPRKSIKKALHRESSLFAMQILISSKERMDREEALICLSGDVQAFLWGYSDVKDISQLFAKQRRDAAVFPLKSFHVPKTQLRLLKALLSSSDKAHLLLWGHPGTGKTELTRSLLSHLRLPAYWINNTYAIESGEQRTLALIAASKQAQKTGGVVVMDEADDFLETRNPLLSGIGERNSKAWLNQFLDENKDIKIIFISNRISDVDPSVLRRLHFKIHFSKNILSEKNTLKYHIKNHPISKKLPLHDLLGVCGRRHLTPAALVTALDAGLLFSGKKKVLAAIQESVLSYERTLGGAADRALATRRNFLETSTRFQESLLNADQDLQQVEKSIKNFLKYGKKSETHDRGVFALLFYGLSGSGKSEYIRHVAHKIGIELKYVRPSDILDKHVGESEQKLRQAFEEAEDKQSALFFDEIDTFLSERSEANRDWQRDLTNEFLTLLENFSGCLFATSNLEQSLDPAVSRRFVWKVQFGSLKAEQIPKAVLHYFPHLKDECKKERAALPDQDELAGLCLGDIRSVWTRQRFLPASAKQPGWKEVSALLRAEIGFRTHKTKERRIGF